MAQQAPTKIIVDPTLVERADIHCPTYMPRTVFLNVLIEEGLDKRTTLREQPGRAAYISTSLEVDKEKEERARALSLQEINKPLEEDARNYAKAVKAAAVLPPPGWEAFWKTYQACPAPGLRVKSQSKPKALDEYRKALKDHTAQQMLDAAKRAVDEQLEAQRRDEWTAPLPDAFRWLRDGKFIAFTENHAPTQQKPAHWL